MYVLPTLAVLPTDAPATVPPATSEGVPATATLVSTTNTLVTVPTYAPIIPEQQPAAEQPVVPNRTIIQFTDVTAQQDYANQLRALGADVTPIDELNTLVVDFPASLPEMPALPDTAKSEPDFWSAPSTTWNKPSPSMTHWQINSGD